MRTLLRSAMLLLLALMSAPVFAQGLPLTMTKSFSPATVTVGGTSTTVMTVTITNPNTFSVGAISFSDTYPAGLVPDVVGAYTCAAGSAVFTGTGWALNNVTLGAGASCSVPMSMHASIVGPIVNTTSQVTAQGVPPGGPANATLNAVAVAVTQIPALSQWVLLLLGAAMIGLALLSLRTRPTR